MLDDFIIRALLAGVAVALATGPLGSFIVWKKMAFFGDALAHSAILGVAIGILLGVNGSVSIAAFAVLFSALIALLKRQNLFEGDTILGMTTNGALALGIIVIALTAPSRFNILNLLFGDILATSYQDIIIMYSGAAVIIGGMIYIWRPLLLATINEDLARVEGVNVPLISFIFTLMVAMMVALSIKIVGVLLVSSLLIIPATTARILSKTPERMAIFASSFGILSIGLGIFSSLKLDTPAGPSIVVVLLVVFAIVSILSLKRQ